MSLLLPANATDIEIKLSDSRKTEIELEQRLNVLINIDSVSDQFLNYLAIQHSVDYWRNEWSPSLKRTVLKQSFNRHKMKGTPAAIKKALEPFGYTTTLVEWWQTNPQGKPGTFYLELDLIGKELNEEVYKEVNRLVRENKPASRHLSNLQITTNPILAICNILVHQTAFTFSSEPKA
ncbi:phage tail protein I [Acinetobacter soli]|uniref:phage tail protein I n=1 Tax=Acinetobacter soli TaxID=487316 RepID=UPI001D0A68C7|nr:phage tail protein I [Acinetobacter soli]MCB8769411.1 phage tail protein I [Acinetobacter soli]